ncbi:MAG: AraC family transcriptional regulator [Clostridia bacterium]|nr:AraC family transcriptional regulator [Clostridia bacterium]
MSFLELRAEEKDYYYFQPRIPQETPPHFHSAPEFLFVEQGNQEVIVDGEKRILGSGEGFFADSFCVHSYKYAQNVRAYVLLGDKSHFDQFFLAMEGKVPPLFFRFENFTLLKELYQYAEKPYKSEGAKTAALEGAANLVLAELANDVPFVSRGQNKQTTFVGQVLQYAQENIRGDLSLSALSKKFGYSQEHLSRLLHKYLAENWTAYVNRLRVRQAQARLLENEGSVSEIALDCGFDSLNTFYRAYHKEFGKRPRRA